MEETYNAVMMKPQDQVAVALASMPIGAAVRVICNELTFEITLKEAIEFGHKFAVAPIRKGEDIVKYGEVIGAALQDIAAGEHVHVHNVEGKRGRGDRNGSVNSG